LGIVAVVYSQNLAPLNSDSLSTTKQNYGSKSKILNPILQPTLLLSMSWSLIGLHNAE